jgi:hypothetical protein
MGGDAAGGPARGERFPETGFGLFGCLVVCRDRRDLIAAEILSIYKSSYMKSEY